MRRVHFGGIALALGVLVTPAAAQNAPPSRGATIGRPVAIPDTASPESTVTPAGLLDRRQYGIPVPVSTPTPGFSAPAPGIPTYVPGTTQMGMQPMGMGQPMGTPMGTPMTGTPMGTPSIVVPPGGMPIPTPPPGYTASPSVTEVRTPDGTAPMQGYPYTLPGGTFVPPVGPDGMVVMPPGMGMGMDGGYPGDCPGGCPTDCGQGCPALERVQGCCTQRWWASAEYLAWWTRKDTVPVLLTTSSPQFFGIPGRGDTTTVLAGDFGNTFHSGGRFAVGRWFGDEQIRGVEGRLFFLGRSDATYSTTSAEFPVLARPFVNVNTPAGMFSQVISLPGLAVGGASVNSQSSLWGAEANYRRFLFGGPCARVDAIVGYRYLDLKEQLSINESFVRTGSPGIGAPAAGGLVTDVFRTENVFNGGQIGLAGEIHRGRWSLDGRATVAFGNLYQTADINGGQTIILPNGTVTRYAGGLLALQGANIGSYNQSKFSVMPEVGVNVGYQLTSHLRLFVGYNFLYIGNALRPGGTIDTNIDAARIPNFPLPGNPAPLAGLPRPAPQFHLSDYYAQGISFGIQFNW
jgi:hypothetical protein